MVLAGGSTRIPLPLTMVSLIRENLQALKSCGRLVFMHAYSGLHVPAQGQAAGGVGYPKTSYEPLRGDLNARVERENKDQRWPGGHRSLTSVG